MHRHKVGFGAGVFVAYVIKFEQRLEGFGIKSDIYFATKLRHFRGFDSLYDMFQNMHILLWNHEPFGRTIPV